MKWNFRKNKKTILTDKQKINWNWGQEVELEETGLDKIKRMNHWLKVNGYKDSKEFFELNKNFKYD